MTDREQAALETVGDAAELLVSTPPIELAEGLRSLGYGRAADHLRMLGVAVSLKQAASAAVIPFPSPPLPPAI